MIRILLLFLFFIMFVGETLGLNVSLAPGLSTKNAILYMLFAWIAIEAIVTSNLKIICLPVIAPFSALVAYAIFSWLVVVLIIDYANYDALRNAISLKSQMADSFFMLLVFMFGLTKMNDIVWLFRMMLWIVVLSNIVTLADAFQLPDLEMLELNYEGRVKGFLGQSNEYGGFLVIFMPATVALFMMESGIRRAIAAVGVIATLVCLVLTFSRGSFVGVVMGGLLGVVFLRKYVPTGMVTRVTASFLVILAVAVLALFSAGFDDLFRDRFSVQGGDAHAISTGRSTLWTRALSVMLEQPVTFLTGYGWNAYDSFRQFRLSVHNTYLNYLFNLGAIGLALFVSVLAAVLSNLRRGVASSSGQVKMCLIGATFGFIGICISMFFSEIYTTGLLMWAFVGLSLRMAFATFEDDGSTAMMVNLE